jgi:parallel beta-helix repeat protein
MAGTCTVTGTCLNPLGQPLPAQPLPQLSVQLINYGTFLPQQTGGSQTVSVAPFYVPVNPTTGAFSFSVVGNDQILPANTLYSIKFPGNAVNYLFYITGSTFNLNTAVPAGVTMPIYSNMPALLSGNNSFTGNNVFTGVTTICDLNGVFTLDGDVYPYTTAGLQAALDAANLAGGGKVIIPPNTNITVTTPILYGSNTILEGSGGTSILTLSTTLGSPIYMIKPMAPGVTNARITGLTFNQSSGTYGANVSNPLMSVDQTSNVEVDHCLFINTITMVVWADSIPGTSNFSFHHNHINGGVGGGVSMFGTLLKMSVCDNIIENVQDDAIAFQQDTNGSPSDILVSRNTLYHNNTRNATLLGTPNGINIYGASYVVVADNIIDGTVSNGILVDVTTTPVRPTFVSVTGNEVSNAGVTISSTSGVPGNGISILGADEFVLVGNVVSKSRAGGFSLTLCTKGTITGNTGTLNGDAGMYCAGTVGSVFSSNILMNNGVVGDNFGVVIENDGAVNCTNLVFTSNRIGDDGPGTQDYGFAIVGGAPGIITISNNDLTGNVTAAFDLAVVPTTYIEFNNIAGQMQIPGNFGFGNGSSGTAVTTTAKGTGTGPTTPGTITGYLQTNITGSVRWIPYCT